MRRDLNGAPLGEVPSVRREGDEHGTAVMRGGRAGPDITAMTVTWVVRDATTPVPGAAALAELRRHTSVDAAAYAFIVGESNLATKGRRHLHRAGRPKDRITFSGFWKHEARSQVA
jgi:NADPH-dependent ferric siderophore reductase